NSSLVGTLLDIGPFEHQSALSTINAIKNNSISLYPNPVSNTLNIKVPYGNTITKVRISNSLGQLIMEDNAPKTSIDLEGLRIKNGIYFVRIESSLGVTTKKIIKE
uniref:T9SS type A sorting domain-containing protein n=1 Tax=Seonamhaeicola sp. TaxID=1912245 RepID=UPI00356A3475